LLRTGGEDHLLPGRRHRELWMSVAAIPAAPTMPGRLDTEAVWLAFQGQLRAFVARRISRSADVEDIVQWVFLRLHQNLHALRQTDRVHAWLYRTARRAVADYYRERARGRELPSGGALDLEPLTRDGERASENEDADFQQVAADCLAPLVEALPAPYRDAIVLADLHGIRLAEAARSAQVSVSGMKSRVQRGRKRLQQLLADSCRIALDRRQGVTSCEGPRTSPVCCRRNEV
jgi:RNA polymerase sigma-70 factor (ECF subfamily)